MKFINFHNCPTKQVAFLPGQSASYIWSAPYSATLDHEISLEILEFILNLIEKVKHGFLLSSMCMFLESNQTNSSSHSFYLQNSGILRTRIDQRGDPMKINFDNFQMQKWVS